jgi:hypothetical protein
MNVQQLLHMLRGYLMVCLATLNTPSFGQSDVLNVPRIAATASKQIYTASELVCIGNDPNFPLDGAYSLGNALDLSALSFAGIGSSEEPFVGSFYGNGYAIVGLCVKQNQDYTGLFRVIGQGALVQDVLIQGGVVQGRAYTGLLAGYNQGSIKKCTVQGKVSGTNDVGGLVGINGKQGEIHNSKALGIVKGSLYEVGGLVGCNLGYIADSRTAIQVQGVRLVGGLAGINDETGIIEHCLAKGKINAEYFVGGLVGHNWFRGKVMHCIAQAEVIGKEFVGGLAGFNYAQAQLLKSSSACVVQGTQYIGKVVGGNRGLISYGLVLQDRWGSRVAKP